jgi:hypothetical protein
MSLKARRRRSQIAAGGGADFEHGRAAGQRKTHRNPVSSSKISHWKERNVCPTANTDR